MSKYMKSEEFKKIKEKMQKKYKNEFKKSVKEIIEVDLYKLYDKYNKKYFNDELPKSKDVTIKWSKRLISYAGRCWKDKKLIKMSVDYHRKFPEQIKNTLVHEMIHLLYKGHGKDFRLKMYKINNIEGEDIVKRHSDEKANIKYVGYCMNHGDIGTRSIAPKRNTEYYCKKCEGRIRWIKID